MARITSPDFLGLNSEPNLIIPASQSEQEINGDRHSQTSRISPANNEHSELINLSLTSGEVQAISSPLSGSEVGLECSCLSSTDGLWMSAPYYVRQIDVSSSKFEEVTNVLLDQPNLNSTHLFRADVLYDSAGLLKTPLQKEEVLRKARVGEQPQVRPAEKNDYRLDSDTCEVPGNFQNFHLTRTVVRKLIPRKPQLDRALGQSCFIYTGDTGLDSSQRNAASVQRLVIYRPHVESEAEMPWYHPPVKALAFLYACSRGIKSVSIHFLPFETLDLDTMPMRLHRTLLSLLHTLVRLSKSEAHDLRHEAVPSKSVGGSHPKTPSSERDADNYVGVHSLTPSALKDTIIPQHIIQDTYTRLKEKYAHDLIDRWVEKTEPFKHVFEDLSIAAFLIELWKQMFLSPGGFPGFVDIACGNGVLVYVLVREGYHGKGFDARRRKTWDVLGIDEYLTEQLCIPQPFLDALNETRESVLPGTNVHTGIFPPSTFIISNHADELTPWTPLLAALSSPLSPNSFLAIPCCSHALSGARHRYSPKDGVSTTVASMEEQPAAGDLRALRATRAKAANHTDDKSMYACLTRKVVKIAQEVSCHVDLTLMRIPSTRNIGIVGNMRRLIGSAKGVENGMEKLTMSEEHRLRSAEECEEDAAAAAASLKVERLIERECLVSGGVQAAARTWVERAQKLQVGKGRGKVNLKSHETSS